MSIWDTDFWPFLWFFCLLLGFFKSIFLIFFSFGVGPMAWFLATELSNSADRPIIQSLSVSCQYATCFLSPLIFFSIYDLFGGWSFLLFIAPLTFTTIYLYFYLPETKNRSIEHILRDLGGERKSINEISTRKNMIFYEMSNPKKQGFIEE